MKGFDEWYFKQNHLGIEPIDHARESYKAGALSRQVEVDELQKRIDEVIYKLELIKADDLRPSRIYYDKGWRDCAIAVLNDLKG